MPHEVNNERPAIETAALQGSRAFEAAEGHVGAEVIGLVPTDVSALDAVPEMPDSSPEAPRETYRDIEARVDGLTAEGNRLSGAINAFDNSEDAAVRERTSAYFDRYYASIAEAAVTGGPVVVPTQQDVPGVPDELVSSFTAYLEVEKQVQVLDGELQGYAPEKTADVHQQARGLEDAIDYRAVVAQAFTKEDPAMPEGKELDRRTALYEASEVIGLRQLLESGQPIDYADLRLAEARLAAITEKYAADGLFKQDQHAAQEVGHTGYTAGQAVAIATTIDAMDSAAEHYKKAGSLFSDELRGKIGDVVRTARDIALATPAAGTVEEVVRGRSGLFRNNELQAAYGERLDQLIADLPKDYAFRGSEVYNKLVEEARSLSPIEALDATTFRGMQEGFLPFDYTVQDIRTLLAASTPALALDQVAEVEFRPFTKEEDPEHNQLGEHIKPEELQGKSRIVISNEEFRTIYEKAEQELAAVGDPAAAAKAAYRARQEMEETIIHEFTHALHNALPAAALAEWDETVASDPTHVSAYVQSKHKEGSYGTKSEDLCDSASLFVEQPDALNAVSDVRYAGLQRIYQEFMPGYDTERGLKPFQERLIASSKALFAQHNMTPAEIRAYFLPHEKSPVKVHIPIDEV